MIMRKKIIKKLNKAIKQLKLKKWQKFPICFPRDRGSEIWCKMGERNSGDAGYRSPYLSHAKRALYHLSYIPRSTAPILKAGLNYFLFILKSYAKIANPINQELNAST